MGDSVMVIGFWGCVGTPLKKAIICKQYETG